jgi:hypothetical protein
MSMAFRSPVADPSLGASPNEDHPGGLGLRPDGDGLLRRPALFALERDNPWGRRPLELAGLRPATDYWLVKWTPDFQPPAPPILSVLPQSLEQLQSQGIAFNLQVKVSHSYRLILQLHLNRPADHLQRRQVELDFDGHRFANQLFGHSP